MTTNPIGTSAIAHSAKMVAQYTILKTGVPVGVIYTVLPGAYVTLDCTAENLASVSFSCLDPTRILAPQADGGGILQPEGVEVQIASGFQVGDTPPVLWTQGVYGITVTDNTTAAATIDTGAGDFPGPGPNLTITGYDRSRRISLALFTDPFTIDAGTPMGEAILAILAAQAPWCTNPNIAPTTFEVALQVLAVGTDPWAAIVEIAASAGMVAYFDQQGVLVVRTAPTTAGSPTALLLVDGPTQLAMSMTTVTSATPGYNGVLVISSSAGSSTGFSGEAYTSTPDSDLYYLGPFGKRPAPPITISSATSTAQCTAMAQVLLSQYLGLSRSVVTDMIPCPFLWAYDLGFIKNAVTTVTGVYILQQATRYLDYTEQESDTWVPMGVPISQLSWLQSPAVAEFGSVNPFTTGATAWTTTWKSYGKSAFGGFPGTPGFSYRDLAGGALLGFGGGWSNLWSGNFVTRALRDGWGGSDDEDVVDDLVDDVEDLGDL